MPSKPKKQSKPKPRRPDSYLDQRTREERAHQEEMWAEMMYLVDRDEQREHGWEMYQLAGLPMPKPDVDEDVDLVGVSADESTHRESSPENP